MTSKKWEAGSSGGGVCLGIIADANSVRGRPARRAHWKIRSLSFFLLSGPFLSLEASQAGLNSGPWPMFHRNAEHDGLSQNAIPTSGNIAWTAVLSDTVEYSSPVIANDGTIYIGDVGKELWAFFPNGFEKWHYHTGGNLRYSTPAVGDDGTIYVGSNDGKLYAVRSNGTLRWAAQTGGPVKTSPAIAPNGTIYVGSDDRKLWAFNSNGTVQWTFTTGDTIRSSPAIGPDGTVYFGSNDGSIYAVWPTGLQRWVGATGAPVRSAPAVGQSGDIIVGSEDGFLYAIRAADGSLDWATYTGHAIKSSPAIGATGKIYVGVSTEIHCYHDDGNAAWMFDTGARVLSSPAVHTKPDFSEIAFCGSDNARLYAISGGAQLWSVQLGGAVRSSPAIGSNAHLYVGALNGRLYSIGAAIPTGIADRAASAEWRLTVDPNPAQPGEEQVFRLLGGTPDGGDIEGLAGTLTILDVTGRRVRSLDHRFDRPTRWDGRDDGGVVLPPGVYHYRWEGLDQSASGRLMRIR